MRQVATARAAREWLLEHGEVDIAVIDIRLESRRAGIELAAWIRAESLAGLFIGKTADAEPEDIRDLSRVGAFSIFQGGGSISPLWASATGAAAERAELDDSLSSIARSARSLLRLLEHSQATAAARAEYLRVLDELERLEAEVLPLPCGSIGDAAISLREIRRTAIQSVMERVDGNASLAARALDVDRRVLRVRRSDSR